MTRRVALLLAALALAGAGCGDDEPAPVDAGSGTSFAAWREAAGQECRKLTTYIATAPDPDAGLEDVRGEAKLRALGRRLGPFVDRLEATGQRIRALPAPDENPEQARAVGDLLVQRAIVLREQIRALEAGDAATAQALGEQEASIGTRVAAAVKTAGLDCD